MLSLIGDVLDVIPWGIAHPVAGVPLAILGWVLFVLVKGYRRCRWCRPGGLVFGSIIARLAGHVPERRRSAGCWRCKGTRLTRHLGAYHVHKVKLSLMQAWEERGER